MAILGTVLIMAALAGMIGCCVVLVRRILRAMRTTQFSSGSPTTTTSDAMARRALPPYGALPGLAPVGPVGGLSPDADLDDPASSSHELYGE